MAWQICSKWDPGPTGRPRFVLLGHCLCPRRPWQPPCSPGPERASPEATLSQADVCAPSACFADGVLPLDMEASELLSDTFEVLSSKEIKLLAMRSKPDKDLLMEDDDMALANVVMQEAQKKLISQVSVFPEVTPSGLLLWPRP